MSAQSTSPSQSSSRPFEQLSGDGTQQAGAAAQFASAQSACPSQSSSVPLVQDSGVGTQQPIVPAQLESAQSACPSQSSSIVFAQDSVAAGRTEGFASSQSSPPQAASIAPS